MALASNFYNHLVSYYSSAAPLFYFCMMVLLLTAVKSKELKWLPNGSEFQLATETSASKSPSKPKTYTSFSSSQDSLPELSEKPISPCHHDIILAKLGPGQVKASTWLFFF